jgi:hypothetical protein
VTVEDVRLAVYASFASTGRAPSGLDASALKALADARHVVLGDDGEIVMAHPFSAVPLGFSVMSSRTLYWGGCAWDSFALPHLLGEDMLVATTCPACGRALAWNVGREEPPEGGEVAHFLVPMAQVWDDVVHACAHQRLCCSPSCASSLPEGYVMDLATLWRLASHWYDGRLDRGYVRREPAEAASYFASVGLRGSFWGLPG